MPTEHWWGHRYKVTSLSGYPIIPNSVAIARNAKARTEWYVLDKAYCCRIVRTFKGKYAEQRAHDVAHNLNAEERAWEVRCRREDEERELARAKNGH